MNNGDTFFILKDFPSYVGAQEKIEQLYLDRNSWAKKALINIANSGYFTSDRTIKEYVRDIWKLGKID